MATYQIKSRKQFLDIVRNSQYVREFYLICGGWAKSWKSITRAAANDCHGNSKIEIINELDDSRQVLTERNVFNSKYTNIGVAIDNGAFFLSDGNPNDDGSDKQYYENDKVSDD